MKEKKERKERKEGIWTRNTRKTQCCKIEIKWGEKSGCEFVEVGWNGNDYYYERKVKKWRTSRSIQIKSKIKNKSNEREEKRREEKKRKTIKRCTEKIKEIVKVKENRWLTEENESVCKQSKSSDLICFVKWLTEKARKRNVV